MLIDAGESKTADAYIKLLDNVLNEENATIQHMVITHWHMDHIGGVEAVRNLLKKLFPTGEQPIVWKLPRSSNDHERSNNEKVIPWQPLQDNQLVEVEGATLQIKYTPGHTSDHACLLLQDDHTLFCGDCVLGEGTTVFEDLHDYMLSLDKILKIRPIKMYPGHGPVLDDPISRIQYYIKHRLQREEQIIKMMDEEAKDAMTEIDFVKQLYKV